jgi:hypothetical protein
MLAAVYIRRLTTLPNTLDPETTRLHVFGMVPPP